NPQVVAALVAVLRLEADIQPVQYALTILYEVVRENSSRYEAMCGALENSNVFEDFLQLLQRPGVDSYTGDRAAFMLSGFMCRARSVAFSEEQVTYFVQHLIAKKFPVSESGRLDALVNILKIDRWRPLVWETPGLPEVLLKDLSLSGSRGPPRD
ncbi:vacuolar ATP synthase subunit h, putative, partial [Eimeria tenella]